MPAMPLAAAAEAGEHRQDEEEKDDEADEEKPADIAVVGAVASFGSRRLDARGSLLGRKLDLLGDRVDAGLDAGRIIARLELARKSGGEGKGGGVRLSTGGGCEKKKKK